MTVLSVLNTISMATDVANKISKTISFPKKFTKPKKETFEKLMIGCLQWEDKQNHSRRVIPQLVKNEDNKPVIFLWVEDDNTGMFKRIKTLSDLP